MFNQLKVLLILVAIFSAYFFYSQYRISVLVESKTELSQELDIVSEQLEQTREAVRAQSRFLRESEVRRQTANEAVRRLEQTLSNSDLERLSIAKPGLIERRINDATREFFNNVEKETSNP